VDPISYLQAAILGAGLVLSGVFAAT